MSIHRYMLAWAKDAPDTGLEDLRTKIAGLGLAPIMDRPRILLAVSPETPRLSGGPITAIGRLFERDHADRLRGLPDDVVRMAGPGTGATFAHRFWGGYVGCVFGDQDHALHLFRDPSGAMPCYYARTGQRILVASHLDLLWHVYGRVTLDRDAVIRRLLMMPYRDRRTCLREVHELLPGDEIAWFGDRTIISRAWAPWDFARKEERWRERRDAVTACRRAVSTAVGAWGREIGRPLLYLSGGLDSSIVAATLHRAGVDFEAVTVATHDPAGDERGYARLVAERLGIRLHETFFDAESIDLQRSTAAHLPRPVARAFNQEADRIGTEIAAAAGTSGFINGGGGDNVFCHLRSVAPLIDILRTAGPGRHAWQTLIGLSRLTHTDIGTVIRHLATRLAERRVAYRWAIDTALLSPAVAMDARVDVDHPWLAPPADVLPGSTAHVALLVAIQNFLEGHDRELVAPVVAPLVAQPVVEASLRTPSWMWISSDGRDRSVAREAFADLLPSRIIQRRSKATPDPVSVEVVERRRPLVLAMLLDGRLAADGVLDKGLIEQMLRGEAPLRASDYARLLALCDVEAWIAAIGRFTEADPVDGGVWRSTGSDAFIASHERY
jgi:asparagine synthase (glutamine-hydrolysing)